MVVVLTGEDIWSYSGGQGTTSIDVVGIVPPKPGDGGSHILCPFILCFPSALAV